jgi:hypothetical protein
VDTSGKEREKRVTLDQLLRGTPRPVDQEDFRDFTRNGAFRKKLYEAWRSLIDDTEGRVALEAFRALVEKRITQPWTPEYTGGLEMALIAAVNKYDNGDKRGSIWAGLPRMALDEVFIRKLERGFNQVCNSYAVYSLAVIKHGNFMRQIEAIGKNRDSVTKEELMGLLRIGIVQYMRRNQ